uniref:APC membrane recruitment protein 2 n=1 Tax=Apteryx owenii TaxID=8824 RepID=A0A8B9QF35_APTOW
CAETACRGRGGAPSRQGRARAGLERRRRRGRTRPAAAMDSHCDCAEPPAVEQPSGKINKTAFKLFKRRKSGGPMPSIFGMKNKGGDGKGASKTGMVRSKTHDGLADAVLESSKKEEPSSGGSGGDQQSKDVNPRAAASLSVSSSSSVAKSHSFFSLLKKNGKSENSKGESADPRAGGRQKKGLKGIFSSMRWHKKDKNGKDERGESSEIQSGLIMPGSLTASLECIKEETPKPLSETQNGCGDIIADQEEEVGSGSGGCEKSTPGAGKLGASKKHRTMVAYQGGGEEMASPDQVDDTYLQEFWDMLSQTEERGPDTQMGGGGGGGGGTRMPEGLKETRGTEGAQNRVVVKHGGLNQISIHLNHKEEQKGREKEQQEGIPNSDEGYWDSTTPGPEEDSATSIRKETIPRDSYSGDALYDLYAEPDENPPGGPSDEEVTCVPRSKPVSPITTTCSLKTPSSTAKDSKIPISIKHLASHPASHATDPSNSHHVAHHHLAKSEIHRTKIPVSKVLVRRVSNRGLAGTTVKAATYQDSAKK